MNKTFSLIYLTLCISYLVVMQFQPYPLDAIHKALPILLLVVVVIKSKVEVHKLAIAALIFSATGDILLNQTYPDKFSHGLMAFGVAQACYAFLFLKWKDWQPSKAFPLIAVWVFYGAILYLLLPVLPKYRFPAYQRLKPTH